MTIYGYGRVSTKNQDLTLQVQSLKQYGISDDLIYTDKMTGANMDRVSLTELLSIVKEGDTIVVKKLDRLGRSVSQVTGLIEKLTAKGVFVKSIDDGVDTSKKSAMGTAMLQLLAMFSEMERNFIMERTQPAIENAKAKGVKFGRPEASHKLYDRAVKEYLAGGVTAKELIASYGKDSNGKDLITEATLFRRIRKYKKEKGIN